MNKIILLKSKFSLNTIVRCLFLSLLIFSDNAISSDELKCIKKDDSIIEKLITKINSHENTVLNLITCEDIKEIKNFNEEKLLVTTGRKRGRYSICLSDDKNYPCKFIIGFFKKNGIPSEMLAELFEIKFSRDGELNETVERLFLEPSSLIR